MVFCTKIISGGAVMTLLQLRYFEVLSKVLHYTKASQELNISQPSLSYAINELELELGVKLFSKVGRKISLTTYGERFLPYVRQILETVDEGVQTVRSMATEAMQQIKLGYMHSISSSLVPAFIQDIYANNIPDSIQFQFMEDTSQAVFDLLENDKLDMVLCTLTADWTESIPVMRQPLYLAVSCNHPLAEMPAACLNDFIKEPLVMLDKQNTLRTQFNQLLDRKGIIPRIAFEVHTCNTALQYVALNLGVAVLPHVSAMDDERISVIPLFENGREISRIVYLSWKKNRAQSMSAQKVIDFIAANHSISL